jgi:hypothetical protein
MRKSLDLCLACFGPFFSLSRQGSDLNQNSIDWRKTLLNDGH